MKGGFLKKLAYCTLASGILLGTAFSFAGCGNYDFTDMHFEFQYAVIEENGKDVLHKIKSWADSDSDSFTISTDCCENYIWSSANRGNLYKNKPDSSAYDYECGHEHE